MKLRMRFIIGFVSLSIAGIFLFQGYWLWNNYHIESRQTQERASLLLEQAIAEALAITIEEMNRDSSLNAPHGAFEIGFAADSLTRQKSRPGKRIVRYYRTTILNPTETTDSVPLVLTKDYYKESYAAIRLAGTAGIYESITQFNPIRVTTIDSLWGLHLRHEGIHNAHFVDELFGRDTVIDTSRPKTLEPTRLLQTRRVSTSMSEDYGLRGYIVDASGIIYRRMFLAGGATLLLALIATACYAYLIRTILRQKSIAQIKNDFVNNMTHELKTPITVTYSAIDTLQTYNLIDDKAKRDEYLTLCKQELKHLTRLVEKILSMAVDERKTLRLHKEAFQPGPLIDQLTRQIALKTGKQVHFRIIDELDGRPIVADKLHLGQAIENLIDNAVKYAGPEPHVTIRLKADKLFTHIEVEDDGIGIAPAHQRRVFERFYRVTDGDRHDVKGFGLGLSYVKEIAERHGGTIRLRSQEGRGSLFTLLIPNPHDTITARRG